MINRILIILTVLISININAQEEKRLALVIGNANYKYLPKLKNPVGDALLISETLDSLGFVVDLHTDITTKRKFVKAITGFGAKRDSFDVGFIFYAGIDKN